MIIFIKHITFFPFTFAIARYPSHDIRELSRTPLIGKCIRYIIRIYSKISAPTDSK